MSSSENESDGEPKKKRIQKPYTCKRKASEEQYNAQDVFNLGYMHEQGLGMKKDWHLAKRLYDLAAETNAHAKVPVAIALLKLQMLSKTEAIKQSPYKFIFYIDENITANWDLYMITVLTLLLRFIMYTRRPYQQQPAEQPAEQQQTPDQQAQTPNLEQLVDQPQLAEQREAANKQQQQPQKTDQQQHEQEQPVQKEGEEPNPQPPQQQKSD